MRDIYEIKNKKRNYIKIIKYKFSCIFYIIKND